MEYRTELKSYKVHKFCEVCHQKRRPGIQPQMEFTGKMFLTDPPKYEHQCPQCHKKETYSKQYPFVESKEISLKEW